MLEWLLRELETLTTRYNVLLTTEDQEAGQDAIAPNDLRNIGLGANDAWNKLNEYFQLTDRSHFYIAAIVLNPCLKWDYFEHHWQDKPLWLKKAKTKMQALWKSHCKQQQKPDLPAQAVPNALARIDPIGDFIRESRVAASANDQYRNYCDAPCLVETPANLLEWWTLQGGELAKLAFDVLSIPAMSSECERVFSSTKQLITPRRNQLKADVIEANECLRNWYHNGYCL